LRQFEEITFQQQISNIGKNAIIQRKDEREVQNCNFIKKGFSHGKELALNNILTLLA